MLRLLYGGVGRGATLTMEDVVPGRYVDVSAAGISWMGKGMLAPPPASRKVPSSS